MDAVQVPVGSGEEGARARIEERVARTVLDHGGRLAVASPEAALSYDDLEEVSGTVAARLAELGVRPGDPVALVAPRSTALVAGALGILKAGAAYVALDPGYPPERQAFMLSDCGATAVVEAEAGARVPQVRSLGAGDASGPGAAVEAQPPLPAGTAYVVYTSGSTGVPKGVAVAHGSLLNLVDWHVRCFGVTAEDRASLVASPGFDASVWELWPYLAVGASVHVPPEEARLEGTSLRDWILGQRLTVVFAPTALAERLMELPWPADASLRFLLTGGDVLRRSPSGDLGFVVVNNYGVTEGTVVSTSVAVSPLEPGGGVPPIGYPVAHSELHVVDEELAPVADGEVGELLIGGPQVALGYLGRPELTAERFLPDHLGERPGGRLYRTGDLVRRRPDGQLEFHGRRDDQVKIRGSRVECSEVAAVLLRHPAVADCVVTVSGGDSAERRLVAYVVRDEPDGDETALRTFLHGFLPEYMVPASFVWMAALPVTPNGKLDRGALPPPGLGLRRASGRPPEGEAETAIAGMVAEMLGLSALGAEEDFFLLGGHSLFAAQLIGALSDRFGVEVSLRSVFEGPSVAELAAEVERLILADLSGMTDPEAEQLLAQSSAEG